MEYIRFSEVNRDEKETWHFYIPVEGNKDTISFLSKHLPESVRIGDKIKSHYSVLPFCIDKKKRYSEDEVDSLVSGCQNDVGIKTHNKLHGASFLLKSFSEYQKSEAVKYLLWVLTSSKEGWTNKFEEWPGYKAKTFTKLVFSDSKKIIFD